MRRSRILLSGGLRDASHFYRGVLTGILKVAKENIFSGLNNVDTYSIFSPYLATEFGFTEEEVSALASSAQLSSDLPVLQAWYNGYRFGGLQPQTMYNPWSILQYLSKPLAGAQAYWKNTSSNALVRDVLVRNADSAGPDIAALMRGETVDKTLDENVVLSDLTHDAGALWSLLTFSGYLTATAAAPTRNGFRVTLRIPNEEVRAVFEDVFVGLLTRSAPSGSVDALVAAMLGGDDRSFERELGHVLKTATSYHDFGRQPVEAVYQAFIVGLLVHLDATHVVRSNREAGYGRADVMVTPRAPGPGAVLELKTIDEDYGETQELALAAAVGQLRDRDYAAEVLAAGASEVRQYGVVFDGKRCWVRMVE